jgi:hypothetical protein
MRRFSVGAHVAIGAYSRNLFGWGWVVRPLGPPSRGLGIIPPPPPPPPLQLALPTHRPTTASPYLTSDPLRLAPTLPPFLPSARPGTVCVGCSPPFQHPRLSCVTHRTSTRRLSLHPRKRAGPRPAGPRPRKPHLFRVRVCACHSALDVLALTTLGLKGKSGCWVGFPGDARTDSSSLPQPCLPRVSSLPPAAHRIGQPPPPRRDDVRRGAASPSSIEDSPVSHRLREVAQRWLAAPPRCQVARPVVVVHDPCVVTNDPGVASRRAYGFRRQYKRN